MKSWDWSRHEYTQEPKIIQNKAEQSGQKRVSSLGNCCEPLWSIASLPTPSTVRGLWYRVRADYGVDSSGKGLLCIKEGPSLPSTHQLLSFPQKMRNANEMKKGKFIRGLEGRRDIEIEDHLDVFMELFSVIRK